MNEDKFGPYQLIRRIATGGMAELFLARSSGMAGLEKLVVIKRILPQLATNEEFVAMFTDEARIAALLQHPNLVQLYELGQTNGSYYMAMEYLPGVDVARINRRLREVGSRWPLENALAITMSVAAGLHYAHERRGLDGKPLNIVHRDVSPQNVVVTGDGSVKLVDFGIAKAENRQGKTQNAAVKGKIPYMSPEQCMAEPLDRRTDIYSLGVLLYELTTGRPLYRAKNEYGVMRAILEQPVPSPVTLVPSYPPRLEHIVMQALQKKRSARFQTAQEMLMELDAFARELQVGAPALALQKFLAGLFQPHELGSLESVLDPNMPPPPSMVREDGVTAVGPFEDPTTPGEDFQFDVSSGFNSGSRSGSGEGVAREQLPSLAGAASLDVGAARAVGASAGGAPLAFTVEMRRLGAVQIVELRGRINEGFLGLELARALAGVVLFDLARVERVTSFGVREWLKLVGDLGARNVDVYLARCAEPFVAQATMIRGFTGNGHVLSVLAPFHCRACSHTFSAEVGTQPQAPTQAPVAACPRCRADAIFDDDPGSFFAFQTRPLAAVPAAVTAAVASLPAFARDEAIAKTVEGDHTRLRISCPLGPAVRWARLLDGIEGELLLDLTGASAPTPEAAQQMAAALTALPPEVTRVRIEGMPVSIFSGAPAMTQGRIAVASVNVSGTCPACQAVRAAVLPFDEVKAQLLNGGALRATCRRCNGTLAVAETDAWRALLLPKQATPPPSHKAAIAAAAVVLGVVLVAFGVTQLQRDPGAAAPPVAVPAAAVDAAAPLPAWATREIRAAAGVDVTGTGPDAKASLADAESLLVQALGAAIPSHAAPPADTAAHLDPALAASRLHALLSDTLAPTRDVVATATGVATRLQLSASQIAAARARYRDTVSFGGAVVALVPPFLAVGEGDIVVSAVDNGSPARAAGLRPADRILRVNGAEASQLQTVRGAFATGTDPVELLIVTASGKRTVLIKR